MRDSRKVYILNLEKKNVSLNDAELNTYIYTSPEYGRSLNVHFCPSCGTTVTVTTDRFPEAQVMMLGTLDDPSSITVDMHMFADEGINAYPLAKMTSYTVNTI